MNIRRFLFWCHLTAGIIAGVVIFTMCVTGVLLAFERQLVAWNDGRVRVNPHSADANRASLESILDFAKTEGQPPAQIIIRASASSPIEMSFGRERTVLIDSSNGTVLADTTGGLRAFFGSVERIHRSLGGQLRGSFGRTVTGVCNAVFLFLVVSGLYLWLPKKYTLHHFKPGLWFRGGLNARARELNWHKVIGVWCALPLFFVVLTGVIMSFGWATNLLYRITGTDPPAAQAGLRPREGSGQPRRPQKHEGRGEIAGNYQSLDQLLVVAEQKVPQWKSIAFRVPEPQEKLVTFSVDEGSGGQPQKRVQLALSRSSGEIKRSEGFQNYNLGRKLRTIARFLHTGEILGMSGQIVAALCSLGGAFLAYTGLALALRRLFGFYQRRMKSIGTSSKSLSTVGQLDVRPKVGEGRR